LTRLSAHRQAGPRIVTELEMSSVFPGDADGGGPHGMGVVPQVVQGGPGQEPLETCLLQRTARPVRALASGPPRQNADSTMLRVRHPAFALSLAASLALALPARATTTLYLNRNGGTYTPGANDSRANTSSVVSSTTVVPAFACGTPAWNEVVACVSGLFSPFDVQVTDVDPGAVPHVELAVGGLPQDVGLPSGVEGVAPFTCAVVPNAIGFVFSAQVGCASPKELCWVAAQQAGTTFGLDHAYLCQDPMTDLTGCGDKSFQDAAAACGELSARACTCGGSTQNSFQRLLTVLGPRPQLPSGGGGGCGTAPGAPGGGSVVVALLALLVARTRRVSRAPASAPVSARRRDPR
jgi:hypothetical protein